VAATRKSFSPNFAIAIAIPVLLLTWFLYQAIEWLIANMPGIWAHEWGLFVTITAVAMAPVWWRVYKAIDKHTLNRQAQIALIRMANETTLSIQNARQSNHNLEVAFNDQMAPKQVRIAPVVEKRTRVDRVVEEAQQEQQELLPVPKTLPTMVRYEEIRPQIPEDHALVGINETGVVTRQRAIKALLWIVGGSGTGKTNSVSMRVEEDYQWGHHFLLIDPHWFKDDSLYNAIKGYSDRFIMPMASEPEDIVQVLDAFLNEFKRRKAGGKWDFPVTIIIDEVGSLVSDKPETEVEEEMIAKIKQVARICGQESRGFEMTGMYISQDAAGLAWLRKRAIMVIAHQLLMMSERLLACNGNAEIARSMDEWPIGRTLIYGIGFKEGQKVYQQPAFAPRQAVVVDAEPQQFFEAPTTPLDYVDDGFPIDEDEPVFEREMVATSLTNTGEIVDSGKWLEKRVPKLPELSKNSSQNAEFGKSGKAKEYKFSDAEKRVLINLYNKFHSIDECLKTMEKGGRYHKDASRILKDAGLL